MKICRHCLWNEECSCVICKDGLTVICSLKMKHVEKDDPACDCFDEKKVELRNENPELYEYQKNTIRTILNNKLPIILNTKRCK